MDRKTLIIVVVAIAITIVMVVMITLVATVLLKPKTTTTSSSSNATASALASGDFTSFNVAGNYAIISVNPQPTDVYATVTINDNGKTIDVKLNNVNNAIAPISIAGIPVTTRTNLTFVANNANSTINYSTNSGNNGALTLTGVLTPLGTTYTFAILRV